MISTLNDYREPADICRVNGWVVGTRLVGVECGISETITITAIGKYKILAICNTHNMELSWTLSSRDWKEIL